MEYFLEDAIEESVEDLIDATPFDGDSDHPESLPQCELHVENQELSFTSDDDSSTRHSSLEVPNIVEMFAEPADAPIVENEDVMIVSEAFVLGDSPQSLGVPDRASHPLVVVGKQEYVLDGTL